MTWHRVWKTTAGLAAPRLMRPVVLMAINQFHHAILGGQLKFLDSFLFQFLSGSKVQFVAKGFQLMFKFQVFLV
jgi:hypothetical protein